MSPVLHCGGMQTSLIRFIVRICSLVSVGGEIYSRPCCFIGGPRFSHSSFVDGFQGPS